MIRILILTAAIILFCIALWAQTAIPPAAGGGSETNPYKIDSLENLYWITEDDTRLDSHYIQTSDIIAYETANWFDGKGWLAISYQNSPPAFPSFTGSYDGDGHTIEGLYINRPDTHYQGLFARISGAKISNLGLINANITGNNNVGTLVGLKSESVINNCYTIAEVTAMGNYSGGLVGRSYNSIVRYSYSSGTVWGDFISGGLIGSIDSNSSVINSYSTSDVIGGSVVGGLIGSINSSVVTRCYSTGFVSGENSGGLLGGGFGTVYNSYWNIETSGQTASAAGQGRTTEQMTYPYPAETYLGWDFDDIWTADTDYEVNDGYPYLQSIDYVSVVEDLTAVEPILLFIFPNPFNSETTIEFSLSRNGEVRLFIYNIKGHQIKTLLNEHRQAGINRTVWDGRDERGRELPSGFYLYQLVTEDKIITRKMIMIK